MATVRRSLLAALAAVAVVAAPASTRAADTYLALKGGVWVPTATDGYQRAVADVASGKFPASGDVELAYGATMGIIGAQIAGGYMWSSSHRRDGDTVNANAVPLYVLGQLRLPIFFIQPYLELGIGGLANFASATAAAPASPPPSSPSWPSAARAWTSSSGRSCSAPRPATCTSPSRPSTGAR